MWSHTGKQPLHWSCLLKVLAVTLDAALSSLVWLSSASVKQNDSQGWGWFSWLHFSAFFSEILFFWKLVSHGGLDFSIFVSSTIWNQCFRSKNCSTAEDRLQRSSCTQDWLSPPRNQGKTWIVKFALESVWFRCSDSEKVFVFRINVRVWSGVGSDPLYPAFHGWRRVPRACTVHCLVVFQASIVARTRVRWRTASFTSALPACTWKIRGALSPGCSTAEIRLSPALRFRPEEHHWSISYTGWPISPGVQSLFLSSTIWNRLWCRGKSTSLRAVWCLVSISLSFPTQAEQKRKITVS